MPDIPTPMLDSMLGFPSPKATEYDLFRLQGECAIRGLVLSRGDAAITLMSASDSARFFRKLDYDADGCWMWQGSTDTAGYGTMCILRTTVYAHRVAHRLYTGMTPPSSLELDHLCRKRACVRPDHCEQVTHQINCQRAADARKATATA